MHADQNRYVAISESMGSQVLSNTIREIASLQTQYFSQNTEPMKRRGQLIRQDLPSQLSVYRDRFCVCLGAFGDAIDFEGRDGIGRKTPAPWVRIFSRELSPSATTGFYCVIHFSVDGTCCFVTVGCASTKWDNDKGDLVKSAKKDIQKKVDWARAIVNQAQIDHAGFNEEIDIGSTLPLPKLFEKATAFCQTHIVSDLSDDKLLTSIDNALEILGAIYQPYSELNDLSSAEICTIEIEATVNPRKKNVASRQGYGLNAHERRAVELQAMEVARNYLEDLGYTVKDQSASQSYDYLAKKDGIETKVEVKGTTSSTADAVLLTVNEVRLHLDVKERTSLAIVSGISFMERGEKPVCTGGQLEYREPSAIEEWYIEPTAYIVRRKS